MQDSLGSLWESLGRALQAFGFPAFVTVALWWFLLLPDQVRQSQTVQFVADRTGATAWTGVLASSILISIAMMSFVRPLTRVLEGYYGPKGTLESWTRKHIEEWTHTWEQFSTEESGGSEVVGKAVERLRLYPREEGYFLPSRLGNALRAGESYGWITHGLSISIFWFHLTSLATDETQASLDANRSQLDQQIAWVWLAVVSTVTAFALTFVAWSWLYLLLSAGFALAARLAYGRAVMAADLYSMCLRHLVDSYRGPLAASLGLRIPPTTAEEREMWLAVNDHLAFGYGWPNTAEWVEKIDEWRLEGD